MIIHIITTIIRNCFVSGKIWSPVLFYAVGLFLCINISKINAQDNIVLDSKFLSSKYSRWGLQEVERKQETVSNVTVVRYYVFSTKDKNAEKRNYFTFSDGKLVASDEEPPDSLKAILSIGFSGIQLSSSPASFPVLQKDNICSFSEVLKDMVIDNQATIWNGKLAENVSLFVHDFSFHLPDESGHMFSKYLYVLQNTDKNAASNSGLGEPASIIELNRGGLPVALISPLKTDIHFAAYNAMVEAGFLKDKMSYPHVSAGPKGLGLVIDSFNIEIGDNKFFKSQLTFRNIPFYKNNQIPAGWLNHELLQNKKEEKFMINKLPFNEYEPVNLNKLKPVPAAADSVLKAELFQGLKTSGVTFDCSRCSFYTDSDLNGLYVTGLSSENVKPEMVYLQFFNKTVFVDFVPVGIISDATQKQLIDSVRIYCYGSRVSFNAKEMFIDVPEIFYIKPVVSSDFRSMSDQFEVKTSGVQPNKLVVSMKSLQPDARASVTENMTDSVVRDPIFVYYLDIAELNNKRLLQFYLQDKLDSIVRNKQRYLLFLSNGSNPIIDSSNEGGYVEIIKKISFLYPETASPKNDKARMVEALIEEELSSADMYFYFFLSPVSYNRFKDYMINEVAMQYNAEVSIIVESIENQRIDNNFNHIELNAKKQ